MAITYLDDEAPTPRKVTYLDDGPTMADAARKAFDEATDPSLLDPRKYTPQNIHEGAQMLPAAGGLAGAAAGAGAASIPFAALGGAAGEAGRQLIDRGLGYTAPATSADAAKQIGIEGAVQGAGQAAGMAGGKVISGVAQGVKRAAPAIAEGLTGLKSYLGKYLLQNPEALAATKGTPDALNGAVEGMQNALVDARKAAGAAHESAQVKSGIAETPQAKRLRLEETGGKPGSPADVYKEGNDLLSLPESPDTIKQLYAQRKRIDSVSKDLAGGRVPGVSTEMDQALAKQRAEINAKLDSMPEAKAFREQDANFHDVAKTYDSLQKSVEDAPKAKGTLLDILKSAPSTKTRFKVDELSPSFSKLNEAAGKDVVKPAMDELVHSLVNSTESESGGGVIAKTVHAVADSLGLNPQTAAKAITKIPGLVEALQKAPKVGGAAAQSLSQALHRRD